MWILVHVKPCKYLERNNAKLNYKQGKIVFAYLTKGKLISIDPIIKFADKIYNCLITPGNHRVEDCPYISVR